MRISAPVPLIRNASDSLANADLVGTLGDGDEHNVDDSDPPIASAITRSALALYGSQYRGRWLVCDNQLIEYFTVEAAQIE